jgi:hypothetical protein
VDTIAKPIWKTIGLEPIDCRASDFEQVGDIVHALTLGAEFESMVDLLRGEFGLASEFHPSALRGLHACAGALGDQAALKFG